MEKNDIVNDRYRIIDKIGEGGYGKVYKVKDLQKNLEYAMKTDYSLKGAALAESKILLDLQGGVGIPKLYDSGKTQNYTYMIVTLLGSNLNEIRKSLNGFSLSTVSLILLQALSRIEFVHSRGYIHRDIKPQQFLLGHKEIIYLVDYGISKKYLFEGHHVSFQSHCLRAGSSSYASINSHIGIRLSRRDDLESLGYMAVWLIQGSLPWQQKNKCNDNKKWQIVFNLKRSISEDELFTGCPKQFKTFFIYVRSLKFDETPNYTYLKQLIISVRTENCLKSKNFDWKTLDKAKHSDGKKIEDHDNDHLIKTKKNLKVTRKTGRVATMININNSLECEKIEHQFLTIPRRVSKTILISSDSKSDLCDNSKEETLKYKLPEFNDRRKIFENLSIFRMSII
jgi:serine/threonine protein kinase